MGCVRVRQDAAGCALLRARQAPRRALHMPTEVCARAGATHLSRGHARGSGARAHAACGRGGGGGGARGRVSSDDENAVGEETMPTSARVKYVPRAKRAR